MDAPLTREVARAERRKPAAVRAVGLAGLFYAYAASSLLWSLANGTHPASRVLLLGFPVHLLAAVFWLRWFVAVYRAVRLAGRARFGMAYAVLGWLVPGLAIVAPKQLVDDVWRAPYAHGVARHQPPPRAVRVWSGLWMATETVSFAVSVLPFDFDVRHLPWLFFVMAAMAWYAVATVRLLTERVALLPRATSGWPVPASVDQMT